MDNFSFDPKTGNKTYSIDTGIYDIDKEYNAAYTIKVPDYKWKCQLTKGTYYFVEEGKQPNAFHRFMQKLCFGVIWRRFDANRD